MIYKDDIQKAMNLPLEDKVEFTKSVIREWYKHWNGNVFVTYSGGKDSTVLLHIARSVYPDIKGVFSNTGLEYPEIYEFVKKTPNVEIAQPKKKFIKVLQEDGFPISNKKVADNISRIQNPTKNNFNSRRLALTGYVSREDKFNKNSKIPKKWFPIAFSDIKVTSFCCDYLKKDPLKEWKKQNKEMRAMIGLMMGEGHRRDLVLQHRSCNVFDKKEPTSVPLKFWTEENIWEYIDKNNIEICSVYKDLNINRTGCTFCGFGVEMEDETNNRFIKIKKSHPKQYNIFINKYGMSKALDYVGVNYGQEPQHDKPLMPNYTCSCCSNTFPMNEIAFITERDWTIQEEENPTPTSGMNLFCKTCAITNKYPVENLLDIPLFGEG